MSSKLIPFVFVTFALLYAAHAVGAQTTDVFERGKIVERVTTRSDSSKSYALYLPSDYSSSKKWPVLYIFDPVARGAFAVEKFRAAAEKYHYILVGSNDSRNGLDWPSLRGVLDTLWRDTHERLAVDEKRSFAAGFSGGARVATMLATACDGCLSGVILSGAGYSQQIKTTADQRFAVLAAAGLDDFNFPELVTLDDSLEELKRVHRFEVFDGIHQWIPEKLADDALAWMTLISMKSGGIPRDDAFINGQLSTRAAIAEKLAAENRYVEAEREYRSIAADFTGLADVPQYSKRLDELDKSSDLKNARRAEKEQMQRQIQMTNQLLTAVRNTPGPDDDRQGNFPTVSDLISRLNRMAASSREDERHVARRTMAGVYASALETAQFDNEPKEQYGLAVTNLQLAVQVIPQNSYIHFELAKAYALDGQRKRAISALNDAASRGFSNSAIVESEPAFAPIRGDEQFIKVIGEIKGNAAKQKN